MTSEPQTNVFYKQASSTAFSFSLHSVRGIAALIVFLGHLEMRINEDILGQGNTGMFNGNTAVTFFFVLSGLVLAASFSKHDLNVANYTNYLVRRAFRILPLVFVTVSLGGLYLFFINDHMPYKFLPDDYGQLTIDKLVAAYVGYSLKPNPPVWSIFVELVASMAIPFFYAAGKKPWLVIALGIALLLFGSFNLGFQHHWNFYMIDFFLGMTILWWGKPVADWLAAKGALIFWLVFIAAVLLFYIPEVVETRIYGDPFYNLIEIFPITFITAMIFYLPNHFSLLANPVFRFLGDVSYSLYLIHALMLVLIVNLLRLFIPTLADMPWLFSFGYIALAVPLCLALAKLSYIYIEQPGILAGKAFLKRWNSRQRLHVN